MAYLQITLKIADANRAAAAGIYQKYKAPFLDTIKGAKSKELLVRIDNAAVRTGHLQPKMHKLIALAVAVTTRSDGCTSVHTQ
jgi:alkylhydroperoxidase/carboxymuconolactone decarboxylase family protein YurZ